MRLIDADALKNELSDKDYITYTHEYGDAIPVDWIMSAIDNAATVDIKPFVSVTFDKDELDRIVDERVIEPIKNGELVIKEERPQGEWIEKAERRGCFAGDKTVYSYTCPFCGAKEFKKYPFCHCGANMREVSEK